MRMNAGDAKRGSNDASGSYGICKQSTLRPLYITRMGDDMHATCTHEQEMVKCVKHFKKYLLTTTKLPLDRVLVKLPFDTKIE